MTAGRFRLGYRPELDGIRAIAVLAVMGYHSAVTGDVLFPALGGYLGVDVFFVLSGFLITTLLVEEHRRSGAISLGSFYLRRARRLLPALYVMLGLVTLLGLVMRLPTSDGALASANLRVMIPSALLYVANLPAALGIRPAEGLWMVWSLAIEEQFYLLWPLVLIAIFGRGWTPRRIMMITALGALGITLWRLVLALGGASIDRIYFASDTRFDGLLLGCTVAFLATGGFLPVSPRAGRLLRAGFWSAAVLLGLILVAGGPARALSPATLSLMTSLASLLSAFILLGILAAPVDRARALLGLRPLVVIGQLSYGLYLWHSVALYFLTPWLGATLPALAFIGFAAVGLAALSAVAIERPAQRWRRSAPLARSLQH